jgi:Meckel syndrome type 1 protein
MTQLRDARFKRALQAAPDAQLGPQEATRRAVREAAARAVQTQPARRKWRWWPASQPRLPWNTAFATVLLASLVTLLWQGRDVPDARTDTAAVDAQSPSAAPTPVPPPAPAPSVAAAPQRPATPRAAPAPQRQLDLHGAAKQAAEATARRESERVHKSAPRDLARQREGAAVPLEDSAQAPASGPGAGVAPPAASPAVPAAQPSARFQAVPPTWQQWSQLRVGPAGHALARVSTPRLAELIERVAASATTEEPLAEAPQSRLELSQDGRLLAVLEIAGAQVRWTVPGAPARTGRPDPAMLQALREELQRLAPR